MIYLRGGSTVDETTRRTITDALNHVKEHAKDFATEPRPGNATKSSAYARLGGGRSVKTLVDRFYELVLNDPDLILYFDGVEMNGLKWHQAALLTSLLGGPGVYHGRSLDVAHKPLKICRCHYERVLYYLDRVMVEMHVPDDVVTVMLQATEDVRNQIVGASWRQRIRCFVGLHRSPTLGGAA